MGHPDIENNVNRKSSIKNSRTGREFVGFTDSPAQWIQYQ